ncbi:hypothetical protein OIDMADRAFT_138528 [Oidiodendron maius Zn]|uniref:Uncharacterized protein n=1 Tax=Oidiodendron maius (strain Zn) TaxID=913774 RepID=A0A0C3CTN5_OIDMZ|nr:hypothetical protein OIDMADRAFT_138528 [Oidiodendron maius Zn]
MDSYQITTYSETIMRTDSDGQPSSPFVPEVPDGDNRENIAPTKIFQRNSNSTVDYERASPLKMLKTRPTVDYRSEPLDKTGGMEKGPRKMSSPDKRFPVKPSTSPEKCRSVVQRSAERTVSLEEVLQGNEGLTKAIKILEDSDSDAHEDRTEDTLTSMNGGPGYDDVPNIDDTIVSTFSTFSAVPEMTMFAKLGQSLTKFAGMGPTPRRSQMDTPATSQRPENRSPSPTPRAHKRSGSKDDGDTTNLILDFTDQINNFSGRYQSPTKYGRKSPLKKSTTPDLYSTITPSVNRHMSNLLDFDIPPAPTPRSMPSITARELETLKSNFLSEISSLKASLSGKEAEVQSLKTAVGDAENRVGESMEQLREERNVREQLAAEKEGWEKRGKEMEAVLRNVKDEIVHGERERDELEGRLVRKSYEHRWEKKVKELEAKIEDLTRENDELRRDATLTKVEPKISLEAPEVLEKQAAKDARNKELEAELKGLSEVVKSVKKDNAELREILDEERVEKSKLVQAVDEMIPLVAAFDDMLAEMNAAPVDKSATARDMHNQSHAIENLRGSISRSSGLRAPTSISSIAPGESRIGRGGFGVSTASGRDRSGSQGRRPGSGLGYRSGIMSSIEKMGNHRGRGE